MYQGRLATSFRRLSRRPNTVGVSFGRALGLGIIMAGLYFIIGASSGPTAPSEPWYQRDYMSLGPAEVIGALAALSTGTIALQVMAQTAYSRQSKTLTEFNHRQNMGMLALSSPAVSCTLAIFALVDGETQLPNALAYMLIVITIAGMNTFIAADAADRLLRVDDNNLEIQLAASRRTLGHYRRKRLPQQPEIPLGLRFARGGWHLLFVSAVVAMGEAFCIPSIDWSRAPRFYLGITISTIIVSLLTFMTIRHWYGADRANRWGFVLLFLAVVLVYAVVIIEVSTGNVWGHITVILGIPIVFAFSAMVTTANRSTWLVPSWLPGTWVRAEVSRSVNRAAVLQSSRMTKRRKNLLQI